jgi:hypothetical protein
MENERRMKGESAVDSLYRIDVASDPHPMSYGVYTSKLLPGSETTAS